MTSFSNLKDFIQKTCILFSKNAQTKGNGLNFPPRFQKAKFDGHAKENPF